MIPRIGRSIFVAGAVLAPTLTVVGLAPASPRTSIEGVEALGAIVGVWQSDTVDGASALSNCTWTPTRGGVVCEQAITTPTGRLHALNLYTYDVASQRYVFYGLSHPGDTMSPVALAIRGSTWTYGGAEKAEGGPASRTINDFSNRGSYAWRQETTQNGRDWVTVRSGRSRRLK